MKKKKREKEKQDEIWPIIFICLTKDFDIKTWKLSEMRFYIWTWFKQ